MSDYFKQEKAPIVIHDKLVVHDQIDGTRELKVVHVLERLRAAAMYRARLKWGSDWDEIRKLRNSLRVTGEIVEIDPETKDIVYLFQSKDVDDKVWSKMTIRMVGAKHE